MQWQIDLDLMALISFGEAELRRRAFPSWSLGTSKAAGRRATASESSPTQCLQYHR